MESVRRRDSFWAERDRRRARAQAPARRHRDRWVARIGYVLATALPIVLWHQLVIDIASQFNFSLHYLISEWSPWVLIVAGLGFCLPVAWSAGADPNSRWYPRARNAYAGWGVTLYLLGIALAFQVSQIWALHT